MAGSLLYVDFAVAPGAAPAPDAPAHLHALLVERAVDWLGRYVMRDDAMGWVEGYYEDAVAYAKRGDLWGVSNGRLVFHFTDFSGLHALGEIAFTHFFELSFSVLSPYLDAEARALGLTLTTAFRSPARITRTSTPLVCLGEHLYWVERDDEGSPVCLSRDDLPRRPVESLNEAEKGRVARVVATGACACPACDFVMPSLFGGDDPFGGSMDWGLGEGGALLEAGDWAGARRELLRGALSGAPWLGLPYELQLACTYALEGDKEGAFRFLRRVVEAGLDDPTYLARDADLANVRGPELDALIGAAPPYAAPKRAHDRRPATPVADVVPVLRGRLGSIARAAGVALRAADPRPHFLPTELSWLRDELAARELRPHIHELALACMHLEPGPTWADLSATLTLSIAPDACLSVIDGDGVERGVRGDGLVVERRTEGDVTLGRATPLEVSRLFADARDARLPQTLEQFDFDAPDPSGAAPAPDRLRSCWPGEADVERVVVTGRADVDAELQALTRHLQEIIQWVTHRDAPSAPRAHRSTRWTLAESRARTLTALVAAAEGTPGEVRIAWQRGPDAGPRTWTSVDAGHVRDQTRDDSMGLTRTDLVGCVPPDAVVRAAKALADAGFPTCGAPDAQLYAMGPTPRGHVALRVWGGFDVPLEVRFPVEALSRSPALDAAFTVLDAVRGSAQPRKAVRESLRLPASASRKGAAPWSMPLHLLVLGDLTGRPATAPVEDLVPLRVDAGNVEALHAKLAPGPATDAVWAGLRALAAAAREAGRADVVLHALDIPYADLHGDADDAPTAAKSGLFSQLVSRHLASWGGTPIDACLLAYDFLARDAELLRSMSIVADWGPTQLFARMPEGIAHRGHRLVSCDPFGAGSALIWAFRDDGLFREIDRLEPDAAVAFRGARLARHLSPIQLSASATHRGFDRVERRAKAWLSSQTGFGRPLSKFALVEEDDQLSTSAIEYSLHATYAGGAEGRARFLLHLGGPLADDPPAEISIAEAIDAHLQGGARVHSVALGGLVVTPTGEVVEEGTSLGPASGETLHRLAEALLPLLRDPPSNQGDELTIAVGGQRATRRVCARDLAARRLAQVRASVDGWAAATTLDLSGKRVSEKELLARLGEAVGLRVLRLADTGVTDGVLRALVELGLLAGLEVLDVHLNAEARDAGVIAVVSSPDARGLKALHLGWTGLTRVAARAMIESPYLTELGLLDVRRTGLHVHAEDWVDQGAVIGHTPRDPEVDELCSRFGERVWVE